MAYRVVGVTRGAAAAARVREYNMFNPMPAPGSEYVLIDVEARFLGGPNDTENVDSWDFHLVGEDGVTYGQPFVVLDDDLDFTLFGGGSHVGQLAFLVREGEGNLVLIYDSLWDKTRYLSVE